MRTTEEQHNERKREIMEKCFECYAENGLTGTGIKALADACGCTKANLYSYFKNLDELIIESTAYCMEKVEDDFMEMAPTDPKDVVRFVKEIPYWTAQKHGKKYRLMYQIYTHPKYIEHGKKFFEGVNERYTEYAKRLEPKIGIPYTVITPLIFIFVRACVHYAMFEDASPGPCKYALSKVHDWLGEELRLPMVPCNGEARAAVEAALAHAGLI